MSPSARAGTWCACQASIWLQPQTQCLMHKITAALTHDRQRAAKEPFGKGRHKLSRRVDGWQTEVLACRFAAAQNDQHGMLA